MMSEKRFEWIDKDTISDNQTDEWYCFLFDDIRDDFVDLLNELNEERNYFERKKCEYFNKYNKKHLDNIQLKEENEQLKEELNNLKKDETMLYHYYTLARYGGD